MRQLTAIGPTTVLNALLHATFAPIAWSWSTTFNVYRDSDLTRVSAPFSRRAFLATALTAGAGALLPGAARAQDSAKQLVAGVRTLEVNGRPAKVFGLTGPDGRPGLILEPADRFRVDLVNEAQAKTIVHWHGQLPPWTEDGFPWPQTPPIEPGATHAYDFAPIAGTFWMHSHQGMQEQRLMAAPLIVRSRADTRADRQEVVLLLHDFSFRAPDEILAGLAGMTPQAAETMANATENASAPRTEPAPSSMSGMPMNGMARGGMAMGSGMAMDLNDVDYDAFLANDRTLADPDIVRVEGPGRVRLRIINAAAASQFWIDLGGAVATVIAADGHDVRPIRASRFPLAIAQRLDLLIDIPRGTSMPALATLEGSRRRTGIVLASPGASVARIVANAAHPAPAIDNSLEVKLTAARPLAARRPDLVHRIVLAGGMKPYAWSLNGEYWPKITPLILEKGHRVEIELVNQSMMPHPMHLHGHAFQVLEVNGKQTRGAVRDTVLVTPMGSVKFAFDADNPGRWAFHCHNLYHMMTGMMTEFRYQGIAV